VLSRFGFDEGMGSRARAREREREAAKFSVFGVAPAASPARLDAGEGSKFSARSGRDFRGFAPNLGAPGCT
jgi:hypothetical protein